MGLRSWEMGELSPVHEPDRESSEIRLRLPEPELEARMTLPTAATVARARARAADLEMDWDDEPDVVTNPYGLRRHAPVAESQVFGEYPALCTDSQPPQSHAVDRGLGWALGALALLALTLGVLLWAAPPPTATVILRSVPQDASLRVDGVLHGQSSPFVVTRLSANELHELRVERPGYRSWWTRVRLRDGEQLNMPTVTLLPAPEVPALALAD